MTFLYDHTLKQNPVIDEKIHFIMPHFFPTDDITSQSGPAHVGWNISGPDILQSGK